MKKGSTKQNQQDTATAAGNSAQVPTRPNVRALISALVLGGLFLGSFAPTTATQLNALNARIGLIEGMSNATVSIAELPDTESGESSDTSDSSASETTESGESEVLDDSSASVHVKGSSTSISIKSSTVSTNDGTSQEQSKPAVTVNGQDVEPDKRGNINSTYKDENTKVRVRGKVKASSDNSATINISVDEQTDAGAD